jgi:hypothetical protein
VTNAFVHGHGDPILEVRVEATCVRVAVSDLDGRVDLVPLSVAQGNEHGRGLRIVATLASAWGVEPRGEGKAVWFELQTDGRPRH